MLNSDHGQKKHIWLLGSTSPFLGGINTGIVECSSGFSMSSTYSGTKKLTYLGQTPE